MGIIELNKELRNQYEKTGDYRIFERYVVSELIAPIEDFDNAIALIRENYSSFISTKLLLIGAYILSFWHHSKENDFLCILNNMYPFMDVCNQSIIDYLNAYQIRQTDKDYNNRKDYYVYLEKSLSYKAKFLNNRLQLAEFYSNKGEAAKLEEIKKTVLEQVEKIVYEADVKKLPDEFFVEPDEYIKEFILGTSRSHISYEALIERLNSM